MYYPGRPQAQDFFFPPSEPMRCSTARWTCTAILRIIHLIPILTLEIALTIGSEAFPAAGAKVQIHSLLRRAPRNTTHFGCPCPSPLVVADLMIIGTRSVTYMFVVPLRWGELHPYAKVSRRPNHQAHVMCMTVWLSLGLLAYINVISCLVMTSGLMPYSSFHATLFSLLWNKQSR
jgi:hypothetical protein